MIQRLLFLLLIGCASVGEKGNLSPSYWVLGYVFVKKPTSGVIRDRFLSLAKGLSHRTGRSLPKQTLKELDKLLKEVKLAFQKVLVGEKNFSIWWVKNLSELLKKWEEILVSWYPPSLVKEYIEREKREVKKWRNKLGLSY